MKKTAIALVLCLALSISLLGCGQTPSESAEGTPSPAGGEFVIGTYLPITGHPAGQEMKDAINLGISEINANGGFNGVMATQLAYDTTMNSEVAVRCVNSMIEKGVNAIIGSNQTAENMAVAKYMEENKVLHIPLGTSDSVINVTEWPHSFRGSFNLNDMAADYAVAMKETLGASRVALFIGQDEAAITSGASVKQACLDAGLEVVAEEQGNTTDSDFTAQVQNILKANPEVIYITITDGGGLFIKQLRQAGYTGIIMNKDVFGTAFQEPAGASSNCDYVVYFAPYIIYSAIEDCDIPIMTEFLKRFYDAYGYLPKTAGCYRAYDGLMLLYEASKNASSNDTEALVKGMNSISGYEGLSGTFDFTSGNHEGLHKFRGFVVIDTKSYSFQDWMTNGGYEKYREATGNAV